MLAPYAHVSVLSAYPKGIFSALGYSDPSPSSVCIVRLTLSLSLCVCLCVRERFFFWIVPLCAVFLSMWFGVKIFILDFTPITQVQTKYVWNYSMKMCVIVHSSELDHSLDCSVVSVQKLKVCF